MIAFGFGKKPIPPVQHEWRTYSAPVESVASVVRRVGPDVILTDAEAEAIMERAKAAAAGYEDRSHRSYQLAYSVFKQKRELKELADLQDEAWRGCVASYISDSD